MKPITGLVVAALRDVVTIKLQTGIEVRAPNTGLRYGDLVYVMYDYTTNTVRKAYRQDRFLVDAVPGPIAEQKIDGEEGLEFGEGVMFAALSLSYQ